MSNGAGPVSGSGGGAFEVQMRGYSRHQVDAFAAKSRSQIHHLEEQLSCSLGEMARLRTELSAARQALPRKPAPEQASGRIGQILILAGEEATAQWARAQDEIRKLHDQAQAEADRLKSETRQQAERMLAAARHQADNTLAAARAEADQTRNTARADSERAVNEAAKQAESTLATATSQANQILGEATTRATAAHDRAGRRLSLLTTQHTRAMRQLIQVQDAMTSLTAQGPLEDQPAGQAATSRPAGSAGAPAPGAPAAANAAQASHPPAPAASPEPTGKPPPCGKAAPN